ncbi:TRAP transporter small permease [Pseudoroseicyclus tamaricis]|uniref:TRAP transporter small permease protein n=1 Tax=Pseudoroseicyclus tamaricis TaxID=2705421 RepID=A0A6B2JI00_9RHOB|nr:TRAP transporter small permease [Pseudoroseicyclus tamaricis]NDV00953.1 TRAP transporter small permease [Pseudoroseicyclus tamaricis]
MQALAKLAGGVSRALAYVGTAAVVAMMLHICLDVALRNLFNIAMNTTPEIVARYYMTGIAFLPLAWLELRRQMISVELLEFAMTDRLRRQSDVVVMIVASLVYVALAWGAWPKALKEARSGTFVELVSLQFEVWHSYFIPAVGFSLAAVACLFTAWGLVSPRAADALGMARE